MHDRNAEMKNYANIFINVVDDDGDAEDDHLAVEGNLAGVEGHQDVVHHHRDVVRGQQEHQQDLSVLDNRQHANNEKHTA